MNAKIFFFFCCKTMIIDFWKSKHFTFQAFYHYGYVIDWETSINLIK